MSERDSRNDQLHGEAQAAGQADNVCELCTQRLVAGERPGDDPVLAAHLGSCLRCFRTAADLRELPRLQKLLREAQAESPPADPGEVFWSGFTGALGKVWEETRSTPASGERAPAARRPAKSALQPSIDRFWAWLRLPVPAAMAGAACAAIVAVMVLRPGTPRVSPMLPGANPMLLAPEPATDSDPAAGAIGQEDIALAAGQPTVDESVGELGEVGLATMLDKLDRELVVPPVQINDAEEQAGEDESSPQDAAGLPSASEEMDGLDERGLQVLRAGLSESI